MGYRAFHLFILSLVLIAAPLAASAQDKTKPAAADPFANVPDAYFQEADDFQHECQSKPDMHQYYNCECLSLEYLKKRIDDPKATRNSIVLSINKMCADATIAAGHAYKQCLTNASLTPGRDMPPEKYCQCYANTYAKLYENAGQAPGSNVFVELQTQAYVACQDPEMAKRLYGQSMPAVKRK